MRAKPTADARRTATRPPSGRVRPALPSRPAQARSRSRAKTAGADDDQQTALGQKARTVPPRAVASVNSALLTTWLTTAGSALPASSVIEAQVEPQDEGEQGVEPLQVHDGEAGARGHYRPARRPARAQARLHEAPKEQLLCRPGEKPDHQHGDEQLLARRPGERAPRLPERAVTAQAGQHGERIEGLAEGEHAEDHHGEVATGLASRHAGAARPAEAPVHEQHVRIRPIDDAAAPASRPGNSRSNTAGATSGYGRGEQRPPPGPKT